jgi:hypothetical protein
MPLAKARLMPRIKSLRSSNESRPENPCCKHIRPRHNVFNYVDALQDVLDVLTKVAVIE